MARRPAGQATVEFALVLPVFVMLVFGIIDIGRAVYVYNGVSQAAREIARVTSVHPGSALGLSPETLAVIATQKALVPGMNNPQFDCVRPNGQVIPGNGAGGCGAPNFVRVEVDEQFSPSALLGLWGPITIGSTSSNQAQ